MEEQQIYKQAVKKWGHALQITQSIQEMAELTKELTKIFQRKTNFDNIIEEIADTQIMLEQLKVILRDKIGLDFDNKYGVAYEAKLLRLEKLLKESQ
jgi:hypothetical protein